ncbi:MAG: Smr/MutS family protein, partial [Desulfovibrio sp.]|nr:Smr/MutS family protein [Desulfovibrio sp.]
NAGGKTVCLKTLGLIYVMAASGLPVPVEKGSQLFWLERLDAFIGDEQDLEDHVSTFTAQIEHLAKAWKYLTQGSLVLLDEFGAGTDPTHGAALAQAVLDSLLERGAVILAATHFPTLKIWALSTEAVRAASMLFDPQSKRPLYRLAYDQVGQSQTLTVAREHGLAPEILARAEKILLLEGEDSAKLLERLNVLAYEREQELKALQSEKRKAEADLKNLTEKLKKEQERLRTEIGKNIQELLKAWKSGRAKAKETLNLLRRERAKLETPEHTEQALDSTLDLSTLSVGTTLKHRGLNKIGQVTAIDERKKRVRLDLGGIVLWANLQELSPCNYATPKQAPSPMVKQEEALALCLDLRGQTQDVALSSVEHFLDQHLLAGFSSVEIIHGRGTGALRKALHTYLSSYPGLDHFALAPEDQGGDGKTIVYFR